MGIPNQIKRLRQQKAEHLRLADAEIKRLSRDVKRVASPKRILRRHLGVAMAATALLGMLVAPGPTYVKRDDGVKQRGKGKHRGKRKIMGMLATALWPHAKRMAAAKMRGNKGAYDPSSEPLSGIDPKDPNQKPPKARAWTDAVLADVLAMLAKRVYWTDLLSKVTVFVKTKTGKSTTEVPADNQAPAGP